MADNRLKSVLAFPYGALNSITFNQLPRIEAGIGAMSEMGDDEAFMKAYDANLKRAYDRREEFKQVGTEFPYYSPDIFGQVASLVAKNPFTAGELVGNPFSKAAKVGTGALWAAKNILATAGKAGLYQSGEQGATDRDMLDTALVAGGATGLLESLGPLGKLIGWGSEKATQAGLGLKRTAMKGAMKKTKDKTLVAEGYEKVRKYLDEADISDTNKQEFNKFFSTGSEAKPEALLRTADKIASKAVKEQESLVVEADKLMKQMASKTKTKMPLLDSDKTFLRELTRDTPFRKSTGLPSGEQSNRIIAAYEKHIAPLQGKLEKGKDITLKDLLAVRKDIAKFYNENSDGVSVAAGTAAINDLNRTIAKNLEALGQQGILPQGAGRAFSVAGKDAQQVLSLRSALEKSSLDNDFLATTGDAMRAGITGGPMAFALYSAGLSPIAATLTAGVASTSVGMSAVGALGRTATSTGKDVMDMAYPLAEKALTTQTSITPPPPQEIRMPTLPDMTPEERRKRAMEILSGKASTQQAPTASKLSPKMLELLGVSTPTTTPPVSSTNSATLPAEDLAMGGVLSPKAQEVMAAAKKAGIDLSVFQDPIEAAQIYQESAFNPNAVSRTGAQGWAQFMPETAKEYGLVDPMDLTQSLTARRAYMQNMGKQFDSPAMQLMGYVAGPSNVNNWMAGKPNQVGEESLAYAPKILSLAKELEPFFNKGNL